MPYRQEILGWLSLVFTLLKVKTCIFNKKHKPPQQSVDTYTYEIYYGILIYCFNYDKNRDGNLILMRENGRG